MRDWERLRQRGLANPWQRFHIGYPFMIDEIVVLFRRLIRPLGGGQLTGIQLAGDAGAQQILRLGQMSQLRTYFFFIFANQTFIIMRQTRESLLLGADLAYKITVKYIQGIISDCDLRQILFINYKESNEILATFVLLGTYPAILFPITRANRLYPSACALPCKIQRFDWRFSQHFRASFYLVPLSRKLILALVRPSMRLMRLECLA